MSGNRSDHDFDWMRDYLVCSVVYEFDLLKTDAKGATDTYSKAYNQKYPHGHDLFECKSVTGKDDCFVVSKTDKTFPGSGNNVVFTRKDDHIEVAVDAAKNDEATKHKITLTLNERRTVPLPDRRRWRIPALAGA